MALSLGACTAPLQQHTQRADLAKSYAEEYVDPVSPAGTELENVSFDQPDESSLGPGDVDLVQRMTVDEALQYALDHHPLLRARQHEVEMAEAKLVGAGLLSNPQLVMDTDVPVASDDMIDLTARLVFTIPTAGKRGLDKAVAREGIRRARLAVSQEIEAVIVEAVDAAMEVLYLQELASLQDELVELASQGAEIQKRRFEIGDITYGRRVRAEANVAALELRRLDSQTQLELARLRLSRAIGQNPPQPVQIDGRLAVEPVAFVPLETVLAAARKTRPELAASWAAVAESQRELALARAEARPDLDIGPRVRSVFGQPDDTVGARLRLDLPLFDRNQGGISESAAEVRVNRAMLEVAELNSLNDVAAAYVELMSIQSRLQFYQSRATPLTERTRTAILDAYEKGVIEGNEVSDLLQEFTSMRIDHLDLRYRYNRLRACLELFLGCPIRDLPEAAPGQPTRQATPWAAQPLPEAADMTPQSLPPPEPILELPETVQPPPTPATSPPEPTTSDEPDPSVPKRLPKPPPRTGFLDAPGPLPGRQVDRIPLL